MELHLLSRQSYLRTIGWTLLLCSLLVAIAASLGRAAVNLSAALTTKPDLAVYLLDESVTSATLIREGKFRRDYLAETKSGPELIVLRQTDGKWHIESKEHLHESNY